MIKILGVKRVLIIVFLIGINLALACGSYLLAAPEIEKSDRQLSRLQGDISARETDINKMQIEFSQLEEQQAAFDKLKARGFFGNQGRREAEQILEKIQKEAGVVSAVANIQRGVAEDNEEAQKAEHKILKSPITIKLEAMDDVDVFKYIYLLEKFFPGDVTVEKLSIKRDAEVSGTVLRAIASGESPVLVSADLELLWRSMIPASQVVETQEGRLQ